MPMGMIGTMIAQLREAVRGAVERRVVVLPHLDLLTTSQGGLTAEAREVIPLLYENPELVWLGFKDPSFPLPQVIENLFPHRVSLLGIARNRLRHLVTQKESRKFGREFNPWALYKYVSGVNAVRLRKLLSHAGRRGLPRRPAARLPPAPPGDARRHAGSARASTSTRDIGGYAKVKERLRAEILDVLARKDQATDAERDRPAGGADPPGHDLLGAARHRQDAFAKAMAAEHRRGRSPSSPGRN